MLGQPLPCVIGAETSVVSDQHNIYALRWWHLKYIYVLQNTVCLNFSVVSFRIGLKFFKKNERKRTSRFANTRQKLKNVPVNGRYTTLRTRYKKLVYSSNLELAMWLMRFKKVSQSSMHGKHDKFADNLTIGLNCPPLIMNSINIEKKP